MVKCVAMLVNHIFRNNFFEREILIQFFKRKFIYTNTMTKFTRISVVHLTVCTSAVRGIQTFPAVFVTHFVHSWGGSDMKQNFPIGHTHLHGNTRTRWSTSFCEVNVIHPDAAVLHEVIRKGTSSFLFS